MENQIRSVLEKEVKELGYNKEITDETNLSADCGFDSLDMVDILLKIENEFNIRIPDDEVNGIKTFGDAVRITLKYM